MTCPLIQQIDYQDPLLIFAPWAGKEGAVFLDSAELRQQCGRYSFIAVDPFYTLVSKNGMVTFNGETKIDDPFQVLQDQLDRFELITQPDLPPFQGGAAGFFSYDLYQHLEHIPSHTMDDMQFPDMSLGFYDLVIAFDHEIKKAWIFSSGLPEQDFSTRQIRAHERLEWLKDSIQQTMLLSMPDTIEDHIIQANFTSEHYQNAVQKSIDYILDGDVFEVCLSQRFKASLPKTIKPFDLYCRLRLLNPAPFAAYLQCGDTVIASASPERFLKLSKGIVESRPIKGTRPRGKDDVEDKKLANELLNSAKDHAENIMIVDLLRNDLSRVCEDHSINVSQLCKLESYRSVHHLVSVITGQLRQDKTVIDLLRASFPGGSITGAPKVRAMEIIAEIEPTRRGPYCGSVGYIGFNGDMDSSIVIRTYVIKNNIVTFQAGGAIVADSNPLEEYEETLTKANALRRALTNDFINR